MTKRTYRISTSNALGTAMFVHAAIALSGCDEAESQLQADSQASEFESEGETGDSGAETEASEQTETPKFADAVEAKKGIVEDGMWVAIAFYAASNFDGTPTVKLASDTLGKDSNGLYSVTDSLPDAHSLNMGPGCDLHLFEENEPEEGADPDYTLAGDATRQKLVSSVSFDSGYNTYRVSCKNKTDARAVAVERRDWDGSNGHYLHLWKDTHENTDLPSTWVGQGVGSMLVNTTDYVDGSVTLATTAGQTLAAIFQSQPNLSEVTDDITRIAEFAFYTGRARDCDPAKTCYIDAVTCEDPEADIVRTNVTSEECVEAAQGALLGAAYCTAYRKCIDPFNGQGITAQPDPAR